MIQRVFPEFLQNFHAMLTGLHFNEISPITRRVKQIENRKLGVDIIFFELVDRYIFVINKITKTGFENRLFQDPAHSVHWIGSEDTVSQGLTQICTSVFICQRSVFSVRPFKCHIFEKHFNIAEQMLLKIFFDSLKFRSKLLHLCINAFLDLLRGETSCFLDTDGCCWGHCFNDNSYIISYFYQKLELRVRSSKYELN